VKKSPIIQSLEQTSEKLKGSGKRKSIMSLINQTEITIDTVTPALTLGQIQISADKRGKELTDAERIRRVVLPANHWGNLTATKDGETVQGLTDVLTNGLRTIANSRLRDFLSENPMARTVAASDYSIASLLAWSSDTASTRGSITFEREQVEQWFPTSRLYRAMAAKGKQFQEFVGNRLATLAAKNHGLKKEEDAYKLMALLSEDSESPLAIELIQRLEHIAKSLAARTSAATVSMDDL
jgi:hypothetical protein